MAGVEPQLPADAARPRRGWSCAFAAQTDRL